MKKTNTEWLHLYEVYRVVKIMEMECRMIDFQGLKGKGNGSSCLMGFIFARLKGFRDLFHNTMNRLITTELMLKIAKTVKYILCIFHYN